MTDKVNCKAKFLLVRLQGWETFVIHILINERLLYGKEEKQKNFFKTI